MVSSRVSTICSSSSHMLLFATSNCAASLLLLPVPVERETKPFGWTEYRQRIWWVADLLLLSKVLESQSIKNVVASVHSLPTSWADGACSCWWCVAPRPPWRRCRSSVQLSVTSVESCRRQAAAGSTCWSETTRTYWWIHLGLQRWAYPLVSEPPRLRSTSDSMEEKEQWVLASSTGLGILFNIDSVKSSRLVFSGMKLTDWLNTVGWINTLPDPANSSVSLHLTCGIELSLLSVWILANWWAPVLSAGGSQASDKRIRLFFFYCTCINV